MAAIKSIGELKWRVRFDKQLVDATDAAGGSLSSWRAQFERWAYIQPLQGSEPVIAQRLTGIQPVIIVVRYDSDTIKIDPAWRAVELHNGDELTRFAIRGIEDMERERKFLTIMAVAGEADA